MAPIRALCLIGKNSFRIAESMENPDNGLHLGSVIPAPEHYDVWVSSNGGSFCIGAFGVYPEKTLLIRTTPMNLNQFKQSHRIVGEPFEMLQDIVTDNELNEFGNSWSAAHPNYHITRNNCQIFAKEFVKNFCGVDISTQTDFYKGLFLFAGVLGAYALYGYIFFI